MLRDRDAATRDVTRRVIALDEASVQESGQTASPTAAGNSLRKDRDFLSNLFVRS